MMAVVVVVVDVTFPFSVLFHLLSNNNIEHGVGKAAPFLEWMEKEKLEKVGMSHPRFLNLTTQRRRKANVFSKLFAPARLSLPLSKCHSLHHFLQGQEGL